MTPLSQGVVSLEVHCLKIAMWCKCFLCLEVTLIDQQTWLAYLYLIDCILTTFYLKQITIVNCLPAVTKVGQLLVSVDEFIKGDGLVLGVLYGLSVGVVGDGFVLLWVEQLHVAVVGGGVVVRQFKQHLQLPVCTLHQQT